MKKLILIMAGLLYSASAFGMDIYQGYNATFPSRNFYGRSFMFTRPIFLHQCMQQASWHDLLYDKPGNLKNSMQFTGAYQHSRANAATAQYFLFPCTTNVSVIGDAIVATDPQKVCRDIRAEWLNLPSDFNGAFTLNPEQSQWCMIAEFNQDLGKVFNCSFLDGYWASIELPISGVTNALNLQQHIFNAGTPDPLNPTAPNDIVQAFNQPSWKFGKISPCKRTKVELAAIWLRMGKAYKADAHQIAYYSGIIFPTSSKQNPEFLFDPVTGFDGHVCINAGVNFNILLNRCTEKVAWYFFANVDDVFLIRNDECRTFGLLHRPNTFFPKPKFLSRFLLFNKQDCPSVQNEPGVNVLTQFVRVKPFNMVDVSTGFRFKTPKGMELELGFDLWGHTKEQLEFRQPYTIAPVWGIAGTGLNSANGSTIEFQAANDAAFTPVMQQDYDVDSAASAGCLNYLAHGSFGYIHHGAIDTFFNTGFFLEFPQKNSALQNWGAWIKVGASI